MSDIQYVRRNTQRSFLSIKMILNANVLDFKRWTNHNSGSVNARFKFWVKSNAEDRVNDNGEKLVERYHQNYLKLKTYIH